MDSWVLPITLLPSIGFFIMATSNLSNAMSSEIDRLIEMDKEAYHDIILLKIKQLGRLNRALVLLYFSASFMALAGFMGGLGVNFHFVPHSGMMLFICIGTGGTLLALFYLIIYATKAVKIKRDQFCIKL